MQNMHTLLLVVILGWMVSFGKSARAAMLEEPSAPVHILLDSDMDTDCDDVAALTLLHVLADRGEAQILATVISGHNEWSPLCMDAINTYFGRGDIPVGAAKTGKVLSSAYTQIVAQSCPHRLASATDAEDAAELMRRVLAEQPDSSVVIVTIGFETNIAALLKLPAEAGKPSGDELIRRKVKSWVCMGGNFVGHPAKDDLARGDWNFEKDAPAAYYAVSHWPGKVVFVGREIGSVPSGLKLGTKFNDLPPDHPLRITYEAFFGGKCKDRHVADPTTVLFAVRGLRDYWQIEDKGYMDLHQDMKFEWRYDVDKQQSYLLKPLVDGKPNDHYIEKTIEDLLMTPAKAKIR